MTTHAVQRPLCRYPVLLFAAALLSAPLVAQTNLESDFTQTLAGQERASSGLDRLTSAEITELNRQIGREISLARQGDVRGFATTFTQRRTEKDRAATGLDRLSAEEKAALDAAIARTIASRRTSIAVRRAENGTSIETTTTRPEIHGEVGLTYAMGSGGRSAYGGSMAMSYEDPTTGVGVSFLYSQMRGDPFLVSDSLYGNDCYGYRYGRSRLPDRR